MADAEFRYAVFLPAGADDTPYRLDLVAQGAQDPAVRLWVRLLVAGFGGIEDAEDALPESQAPGYAGELGDVLVCASNASVYRAKASSIASAVEPPICGKTWL